MMELLKLTLYHDLLLRCLFLSCFSILVSWICCRLNDHLTHPGGLEVHTRTLDASGCWASSSIEFPWGNACIRKIKIRALFSKLASSAMRVFKHRHHADLRTDLNDLRHTMAAAIAGAFVSGASKCFFPCETLGKPRSFLLEGFCWILAALLHVYSNRVWLSFSWGMRVRIRARPSHHEDEGVRWKCGDLEMPCYCCSRFFNHLLPFFFKMK